MGCSLTKEQQGVADVSNCCESQVGDLHSVERNVASIDTSNLSNFHSWGCNQPSTNKDCYLQVVTVTDTVPQQVTYANLLAHKPALGGLDLPADRGSRRASSLAPGPDTPSATPYRDALHGSETGRRFSWRATAAVLQARARRFSSSSTADRFSERRSTETVRDHELSGISQSQRDDSHGTTALGYTDMPSGKSTHQHVLHKDSHEFEDPVNLTPQSVIPAIHGNSTRTTPSDVVVCVSHGQAAQYQRQASHGALHHAQRTSAELADQREAAARFAAAATPHSLRERQTSVPVAARCQHRVRRALSTLAKGGPSASQHQMASQYTSRRSDGHINHRALSPSASFLSWAAREKSFQRMVPHAASSMDDPPAALIATEDIEARHCPPPLPSNELARQAAVEALNILQDPPAAALHDVAACAASAFQVPVVVITIIGNKTVWCQVRHNTLCSSSVALAPCL